MVDLIDFKQERLNDVVADEFKPRVSKVVHHVLLPPGEEIVNHDHTVASRHQPIHQVRPDETGSAGDNDPEPLSLDPQWNLPDGVDAVVERRLLVLVVEVRDRDRLIKGGGGEGGG